MRPIMLLLILTALSACKPTAQPPEPASPDITPTSQELANGTVVYSQSIASPTGTVWKAEDVGGGGIIDSSHITLTLDPKNGTANGSAGCNRYTARYTLEKNRLTITGIAGTKKACAPALMEQEKRYAALLTKVEHWQIEPSGALVLTTKDKKPLRFFPEE